MQSVALFGSRVFSGPWLTADCSAWAVELIAEDRVTDLCHVDANLMVAACEQSAVHQTAASKLLNNADLCDGRSGITGCSGRRHEYSESVRVPTDR